MPELMLKRVRMSHLFVYEPSEPLEEGQKPKFRGKFIFENDKQDDKVRDAILEACIDKFGEKAGQKLFDRIIDNPEKCCYRDGDEYTDDEGKVRDGYEGNWYIAANSLKKPLLIDRARDEVGEEEGLIISGNYANVKIDIYAYEHKKSKSRGVTAQLMGIQFVAEGEPLGGGGRRANADDFDELDEDDEDDAPRGKKGKGKPSKAKRRRDDDDDDDEPRGKRKSKRRRDDDDDDDEPRSKRRSKRRRDDDDDDDE